MIVLAVDPGRDKCGVAVVRASGEVLTQAVVLRGHVVAQVAQLWSEYAPQTLLLGDATGARELEAELRRTLPQAQIRRVDERNSSLQARALYWRAHPPRGWRRLLPLSLQTPPSPLDDFAAIVLAQRFFAEAE